LITRDVRQLSEIEQAPEMRALARRLAAHSGQLLVANAMSRDSGLSVMTVGR
jgi:predicted AAA+ superfamily ATPase